MEVLIFAAVYIKVSHLLQFFLCFALLEFISKKISILCSWNWNSDIDQNNSGQTHFS